MCVCVCVCVCVCINSEKIRISPYYFCFITTSFISALSIK